MWQQALSFSNIMIKVQSDDEGKFDEREREIEIQLSKQFVEKNCLF